MFGLFRRSRRLLLIPVIPGIWVVTLLCLVMSAGPAAADSLVGASPGSGTRVRSSPSSVELTFDAPIMPRSAQITVSGPKGPADSGTEQTDLMTVSQPLRSNLADGTYTVSWRASFFLTLPRSGSYTFTIRRPVSAAPTPVTNPTPKVKATPRTVATRTPAPTPRATATPAAAATTDDLALSLAASEPGTTATVPAPAVQSVTATGSAHLPSPIVLWGLILMLCVVAVLISRWRTSRIPPPRRVSRRPSPEVLGETTELPALAAPVAPSRSSASSASSSSSSTTATLTAPISPALQHSRTTSTTGSIRRAELRRAESRPAESRRAESRRAESPRSGEHQPADDAAITEEFPGLLPYEPDWTGKPETGKT